MIKRKEKEVNDLSRSTGISSQIVFFVILLSCLYKGHFLVSFKKNKDFKSAFKQVILVNGLIFTMNFK